MLKKCPVTDRNVVFVPSCCQVSAVTNFFGVFSAFGANYPLLLCPDSCLCSFALVFFTLASSCFFSLTALSSSPLPAPSSSPLPAPSSSHLLALSSSPLPASSSPLPALFPFGLASSFCFCKDAANLSAQLWRSAFSASLLGYCQLFLLCPASLLGYCQLLLLVPLVLLLLLCPASLHEVHAKQEVSKAAGEGPGCSSSSRQSVWPRAGRPCWKPVCRYGLWLRV